MRNGIILGVLSWVMIAYLTACSFQVEIGYHGQTGRDDRKYTYLKAKTPEQLKAANKELY